MGNSNSQESSGIQNRAPLVPSLSKVSLGTAALPPPSCPIAPVFEPLSTQPTLSLPYFLLEIIRARYGVLSDEVLTVDITLQIRNLVKQAGGGVSLYLPRGDKKELFSQVSDPAPDAQKQLEIAFRRHIPGQLSKPEMQVWEADDYIDLRTLPLPEKGLYICHAFGSYGLPQGVQIRSPKTPKKHRREKILQELKSHLSSGELIGGSTGKVSIQNAPKEHEHEESTESDLENSVSGGPSILLSKRITTPPNPQRVKPVDHNYVDLTRDLRELNQLNGGMGIILYQKSQIPGWKDIPTPKLSLARHHSQLADALTSSLSDQNPLPSQDTSDLTHPQAQATLLLGASPGDLIQFALKNDLDGRKGKKYLTIVFILDQQEYTYTWSSRDTIWLTSEYFLREDKACHLSNVTHFDHSELQLLYRNFRSFVHPDNFLTEKKLISLCPDLDHPIVLQSLFRAMDADDNRQVDFDEFLKCVSYLARGSPDEKIEWTFKICDLDSNGSLQASEVNQIFGTIEKVMLSLGSDSWSYGQASDIINEIFSQEAVRNLEQVKNDTEEKGEVVSDLYDSNVSVPADLSDLNNSNNIHYQTPVNTVGLTREQFFKITKHYPDFYECFGFFPFIKKVIVLPVELELFQQFRSFNDAELVVHETSATSTPTNSSPVVQLTLSQQEEIERMDSGAILNFRTATQMNCVNENMLEVELEGWLEKEKPKSTIAEVLHLQRYDRRWFLVRGGFLAYYKDANTHHHPTNVVALCGSITIRALNESLRQHRHHHRRRRFGQKLLGGCARPNVSDPEAQEPQPGVHQTIQPIEGASETPQPQLPDSKTDPQPDGHQALVQTLGDDSDDSTDEDEDQSSAGERVIRLNPFAATNGIQVSALRFERKLIASSLAAQQRWCFALRQNIRPGSALDHRFKSFAPLRKNCSAKFFINGAPYFERLYNFIPKARHRILITDWYLSPKLYLKRGLKKEEDDSSEKIRSFSGIFSGAFASLPTLAASRSPAELNIKDAHRLKEDWRLDNLLLERAQQGVKIYIILWNASTIAFSLQAEEVARYLEDLHHNIHVLRHPTFTPMTWSHHQKCFVIDDQIAFVGGLDLSFGRYEIDTYPVTDPKNEIYVGRDYLNLSVGEANGEPLDHPIDRHQVVRTPWHDIQVQLIGGVARDVAYNFIQRWNWAIYSGARGFKESTNNTIIPLRTDLVNPLLLKHQPPPSPRRSPSVSSQPQPQSSSLSPSTQTTGGPVSPRGFFHPFKLFGHDEAKYQPIGGGASSPTPTKLTTNESGTSEETEFELFGYNNLDCQMVRSVEPWSAGVDRPESSIQKAYISMITNSKYYIFIANQYFVSTIDGLTPKNKIAKAIYQRIKKAIENKEVFRVYIVLPVHPAGNPATATVRYIIKYTYRTIYRGPSSILGRLMAEFPDVDVSEYITFHAMRNYGILRSRVDTPQPVNAPPDSNPNSLSGPKLVCEQIYVHAKMMIVDDRSCIIGSANINDRSMRGTRDSEICVVINESDNLKAGLMDGVETQVGPFCSSLRISLWKNYLGIDDDLVSQLQDPIGRVFYHGLWKCRSNQNSLVYTSVFPDLPETIRTVAHWTRACGPTGLTGGISIANFDQPSQDQTSQQLGTSASRLNSQGLSYGGVEAAVAVTIPDSRISRFEKDLEERLEKLKALRGYLIDLPIQFLVDENLAPTIGDVEFVLPKATFL